MMYYFHVEDGVRISDPNGQEFPDDASAMREATKVAKELSKNSIQGHPWHVLVTNADGLRIGQVPLTRGPLGEEADDLAPIILH